MLEERQKLWAPKECLLARPSYLPRGAAIVGGDYVKWKCFFFLGGMSMALSCELRLSAEDWLRGIDNTASDSEDSAKALVA